MDETEELNEVTVMSDFGHSIFWDEEGVNICMKEYGISDKLLKEFEDWHRKFERYGYNNPNFKWRQYHRKGKVLAKKLKEEFKDELKVFYQKPFEDRGRHHNPVLIY